MKSLSIHIFCCCLFALSAGNVYATDPLKEHNFLVLSDIHLDQSGKHTMEISPSRADPDNDLDPATLTKLLHGVSDNIQNGRIAQPNFILVLGDLVGHARTTRDAVVETEITVFSALKDNFGDVPILYVFGNNDSLAANYGPYTALSDADPASPLRSPADVATKKAGWGHGFLSTGVNCANEAEQYPCLIDADTTHGYYAAYVKSRLRLIALNSVLFSRKQHGVAEHDAADELNWMTHQLELATDRHESVLIVMHIPFGNNVYDHSPFWSEKVQDSFLKTLATYRANIIGLLASHTHEEELKVVRDDKGANIAGLYFAPGLSTSHGNEPAVKTFYLARQVDSWLLSSYETFHFSDEDGGVVFSKLYDFRSAYCMHEDPAGMSACLKHVSTDKMKKYYSAGNKNFGGTMNAPADLIVMVP